MQKATKENILSQNLKVSFCFVKIVMPHLSISLHSFLPLLRSTLFLPFNCTSPQQATSVDKYFKKKEKEK
jgi:hypothetical protein